MRKREKILTTDYTHAEWDFYTHAEGIFILTQRRRVRRVLRRVIICKPLMEYTEYQGGENSQDSMLPQ